MLYFSNPGEIDIRGAMIAGLSAKESTSAIGFFGTGLKYAIASVLRWGGEITIYSGEDAYEFSKSPINFRGTDFEQIVMRPRGSAACQELGFTTEYGKKWEPWQVFRELYANALDEGGEVRMNFVQPQPGYTVIEIANCKVLEEVYRDRDEIILPQTIHYTECNSIASTVMLDTKYVYYKSVRVSYDNCTLLWNFHKDLDLTEDRTLSNIYEAYSIAGSAMTKWINEELITRVFTAEKGTFESNIDFPAYRTYTPEFLGIACRLYKQNPNAHKRLKQLIAKHKPELVEPTPIELSPMRQRMLKRSMELCARMNVTPSNHTICVAELGKDVLGQYNPTTGKIYLSPVVFDQGTKQVVSTLFEELIHAETGRKDCTYEMQTFLFNLIASLYEEHVFQEPI